jgi:UDP-glucose 4-epimerase
MAVRAAVRNPEHWAAIDGVTTVIAPDLADEHGHWPLDGVDVVVHTAARVHVMNPEPDEANRFQSVNRDGSVRLGQACVQAGVKRLVFLSTVKVHGEYTEPSVPFRASDQLAPTDPYAQSKLQAEQGLQAIASHSDLEVVVVRPPLVYGPGAKGNLALLERWIRKGWPLPIGALDSNGRSLVSLANLVDLIARCVTHPQAANQVFLVSDGQDVSTRALAESIARVCGLPLKVFWVPPRLLALGAGLLGRADMVRRLTQNLQVDSAPTCQRLDWQPVQTLDQGMASAFKPDGFTGPN